MHALLSIAVSNAVGAVPLAVIAAVATRFCRSSVVRHALWLLVLLKLITPPLVTLSIPWPQTEKTDVPSAEAPPSLDTTTGRLTPAGEAPDRPADEQLDQPTDEQLDQPADAGRSPPSLTEITIPLVVAVWLTGSFAWWTLAAVRLRRFQRLVRQARPAPTEVGEQARRLAVNRG